MNLLMPLLESPLNLKGRRTPHFPFGYSAEERAYLEEQAPKQPLGACIREQLLGNRAQKRRSLRKPSQEDVQHAEAPGRVAPDKTAISRPRFVTIVAGIRRRRRWRRWSRG